MKKISYGFTLVELMVVLVILAILAAMAVLIFNNNTDYARKNSCDANIRVVEGAVTMYNAQVGKWPSSVDDLLDTETVDGKTYGPWLKPPNPVCPVNSSATYTIDSDGKVTCSH